MRLTFLPSLNYTRYFTSTPNSVTFNLLFFFWHECMCDCRLHIQHRYKTCTLTRTTYEGTPIKEVDLAMEEHMTCRNLSCSNRDGYQNWTRGRNCLVQWESWAITKCLAIVRKLPHPSPLFYSSVLWMEAFLPERKLLRQGKLRKVQVPRALSPDYRAVKTSSEERLWWSCLEIGQEAPGMQLLSVVMRAGVGFLVIKLSLSHSWSW